MRAKEFISDQTEFYDAEYAADHPGYEQREIPGAFTIPDASINFYHMYRYGILMAASPNNTQSRFDDQSTLGDKMIIAPYSDVDAKIMQGASLASKMSANKSHRYSIKDENPEVNRTSPVAKFKPTRRPS
jgi:hypothetical protein